MDEPTTTGRALVAERCLCKTENDCALVAEVERLRVAKRHALQIADERGKENVALRAEVLKWQAEAGKFGPGMEAMEDLLQEERAKNDRLRGMLYRISQDIRRELNGYTQEGKSEYSADGQLTQDGK